MTEEALRGVRTELPSLRRLLCARQMFPVEVHHLGVGFGQVGQELLDQLPHQIIIETPPASKINRY